MQLENLAMQLRDAITFIWTKIFEEQRIEGESEGKQKSFLDISLQLQNVHVGWYSVTVCFGILFHGLVFHILQMSFVIT